MVATEFLRLKLIFSPLFSAEVEEKLIKQKKYLIAGRKLTEDLKLI